MTAPAPLRVLHAPTNIGNQPWVLSRHERALGLTSDLVVHYVPPSLLYPADRAVGTLGGTSEAEIAARTREGLLAPLDYDVLHYYFGRTLMSWDDLAGEDPLPYLDLTVARALGRRVFFTMQGCDARLAGESAARNAVTPCREGLCRFAATCHASLDDKRRAMMAAALPHADKVFYLNPELGHYLPEGAEFLPYSNVDVRAIEVRPPSLTGRPRVLHAPSDGAIKGTAAILAALESLRATHDFELVLIQDMPHAVAMEHYRSADLVIDQVLAGWYGGFAVEVMAMGKPVLCYLREEDFGRVPAAMVADIPVVNLHPDRLAEGIGAALDARATWPEWSARSRAYVERWHDPARIAAAMVAAYRDPAAPFAP